jgi:hypothetical protein
MQYQTAQLKSNIDDLLINDVSYGEINWTKIKRAPPDNVTAVKTSQHIKK